MSNTFISFSLIDWKTVERHDHISISFIVFGNSFGKCMTVVLFLKICGITSKFTFVMIQILYYFTETGFEGLDSEKGKEN